MKNKIIFDGQSQQNTANPQMEAEESRKTERKQKRKCKGGMRKSRERRKIAQNKTLGKVGNGNYTCWALNTVVEWRLERGRPVGARREQGPRRAQKPVRVCGRMARRKS